MFGQDIEQYSSGSNSFGINIEVRVFANFPKTETIEERSMIQDRIIEKLPEYLNNIIRHYGLKGKVSLDRIENLPEENPTVPRTLGDCRAPSKCIGKNVVGNDLQFDCGVLSKRVHIADCPCVDYQEED